MGFSRDDAFIVDCLPDSRSSVGVRKRLGDTYDGFARRVGAPVANLREHPNENEIVAEALADHVGRLCSQIEAAQPDVIVTLGNAAARVVAALNGQPDRSGVLVADTYGQERSVTIAGRDIAWQAMIHPAAPALWQDRHTGWQRRSLDIA